MGTQELERTVSMALTKKQIDIVREYVGEQLGYTDIETVSVISLTEKSVEKAIKSVVSEQKQTKCIILISGLK